ncbi:thiamine phosphate synthase [[Haemophilus] felis]|uniref:Thiamine-phosphate synthase n=1 Tax=[Haemophilus] felis TaxID=123822 RepID=A0A1T0AXG6_9PAST|nr:thiamine phosphate synthase [[Haemophilus] felis]OOS02446.1 thiamine-phosphate diphosphorylase [[Haemophilus] felis]
MTQYNVRAAMQLYFIAGTQDVSHLAGDPADNLLNVLEQALQSGITCYQFREKGAKSLKDPAACKALAIRCRDLCRQYKVPFVIDDNVELAVDIGADGVHVGQTDMPPEQVKQRVGGNCFVGTSVNTLEQGLSAQANPFVDYFGTGPIFPTQSKEDPKPVVGVEFISTIRSHGIDKPIVAIGGVTAETAAFLRIKGADGVAIISAITRSHNIPQTVKELLQ